MANFVRRLVSGNKARFKDDHLDLELDLVYVTDNIIIMGYPATSLEGIYRNRREDTKKFLDHRHKNSYWIFNFCPLQENSYPASAFEGCVSRYPFPDHHAPPLAILPLATREIRVWLDSSADRVAVLHCKAGKGRSGTLACAFLLSLDESPGPPRLERSYSTKEWSKARADEWMKVVEDEGVLDAVESTDKEKAVERSQSPNEDLQKEATLSNASTTPSHTAGSPLESSVEINRATLESVLALHTQRRMKTFSSPKGKQKHGVSIPSQQRYLYYWSQILSNAAPAGLWSLRMPPNIEPKHQARIVEITVRLKEPSGAKHHVVRIANTVLDTAAQMAGNGKGLPGGTIWMSLARYDDHFVETLEKWELHSRHEFAVGRRRSGSDHMEGESLHQIFERGQWDSSKMVRRFATMGHRNRDPLMTVSEKGDKILSYALIPLTDSNWTSIKKTIENELPKSSSLPGTSDEASVTSLHTCRTIEEDDGLVVDARREIRVKLYMGKIPMGWFWFIPTFHMSQAQPTAHLHLTRKEIDFPLGPGDWLIDIDVSMEWIVDQTRQPAKQMSAESDQI